MGGFEGACFPFWDGRWIDSISGTYHDANCAPDYRLMQSLGLRTARDSFRWPNIEFAPNRYDWGSINPMLLAATETDMQVIWDLCHFGVPAHVDITRDDFPERFAAFAFAAAELVRAADGRPPWYCLINEISYWSYAAGTARYIYPALAGSADLLKRQFIKAYIAARRAVSSVDGRARFLATDPLIYVTDTAGFECGGEREAGFAAWDMLLGIREPELGGLSDGFDVIGLNFYSTNQWRRDSGRGVGMGELGYRPLRLLLADVWERYRKPILISETGAEGINGPNWFNYVLSEANSARLSGIEVVGICTYPITDYPGWVDGRHCNCGPISLDARFGERTVSSPMAHAIQAAAVGIRPQSYDTLCRPTGESDHRAGLLLSRDEIKARARG
jgi:beta-glucosidase/6-phospho-beta-glucosidase/beta-galactosidase